MTFFVANSIEVLNLSRMADSSGMIIPPEAFISFPPNLSVYYGENYKAGTATLRKVGNSILADLVLKSKMKDFNTAMTMIANLYPAVSFTVEEAVNESIFKLKITDIFLTQYPNDDLTIAKIGNRVCMMKNKKDLH